MNAILSQIPENGALLRVFAEMGIAGAMLYWFAVRNERKMDILGSKIDDNTWSNVMMAKAQLISLVTLGQLDSAVRRQADGLLDEIAQKYPNRGMPDKTNNK